MINKRKVSARIFMIILALGIFCLGLNCFTINTNNQITNILAEDEAVATSLSTYLSAPEILEANPATKTLFVYDSYTQKLSSFDSESKTFIATSDWTGEVLSLCHSDTHFLALIKSNDQTNGEHNALYLIDETTLARTKLTYDYRQQITAFTACGEKVYMYLPSESAIKTATVDTSDNSLDRENSEVITNTELGAEVIESLMLSSDTLYFTTIIDGKHAVCKVNNTDHVISAETLYTSSSTSETFIYCTPHNENGNCILTSSNYLLSINGNSVTRSSRKIPTSAVNSKLTSVTFIGTTRYFTDINMQTIWKYATTDSMMTAIFKNATVSPSIVNAKEHQYIEITKDTGLYATPYATESIVNLTIGTRLIVIAKDDPAYTGFYYCIYTTKTENIYGYIKKGDSYALLEKTNVYIPLKVIGDTNNNVFYLPSGITDSNNQNFKQLTSRSQTTQVMAQKVTNSAGDDFYLIELDDGVWGYIRYSQVTTNFASIQTERIKCNGKTKRETTLLVSPSSSADTTYTEEEIDAFNSTIVLDANTRILLNEKVKAGNKYTKVTYQTETGETYTGYIQTADIDADGLTPLQTAGVILVAINIIILVIILVARKRIISNRDRDAIPTAD